jgi:hypothetical protein
MHISASYSEHDLEILGCIYLCVYIRYLQLAKAEKLKPAEVELKRLEDLAQSLVFDFAYMRSREEQMRDTNESTNSRVMYFGIFSMCCLVFLAGWQLFYLRRYFRSKKLIE